MGLGSGRTQNCHGGEAKCLAECIGETEIVSVGAQLSNHSCSEHQACSQKASYPWISNRLGVSTLSKEESAVNIIVFLL